MRDKLTVISRVNLSLSCCGLPLCPGYSQARFRPSKLWACRKLMADLMKAARLSGLTTMEMKLLDEWIKVWHILLGIQYFGPVKCVKISDELTGSLHSLCLQLTAESSVLDCFIAKDVKNQIWFTVCLMGTSHFWGIHLPGWTKMWYLFF